MLLKKNQTVLITWLTLTLTGSLSAQLKEGNSYAVPQTVDTVFDFENETVTGTDFTLGVAPFTIRVIGFKLETVDNPALAHSGSKALVLEAGQEGKIYVMGTDTTNEMIAIVMEGDILLAINSQFPQDMGAGAMRAALKAIKGEKIDQYTQLIPTKLYTSLDQIAAAQWLIDHADGLP